MREVDATRGSRTPLQAAPKPSRLRAAAGPGETDQSARGTPGLQLLRCPPRDWRSVSPYNHASRMRPRTLATNAESMRCRRSIRRVHSREGERQLPRRRTSACAHRHARRRAAPDASSWAIAQAGGSSCHPDSDERFRRKRSCGPVGGRCRCRIRTLGASFPLVASAWRRPWDGQSERWPCGADR